MNHHFATRAILLVLLFGLLPGPAPEASGEPPDSIWTNARIYTANPARPWASALAVRDGKVHAIGSTDAIENLAGAATKRRDLGGRLVLPGLIDSHAHPGYIAMYDGLLELPAATDRAGQLAGIAELIAAHPDRDVIKGIGWDNRWFGTEGPHRRDLDAIEADRPVMLWDVTMHTLWVNTAALELAGVDDSVIDPLPGVSYYQRDAEGALTGYITESAATEFSNRTGGMSDEAADVLRAYLQYLASVGVTTVFDAGNFGADEAVYAAVSRLDATGRLPQRYFGAYTLFLRRQLPDAIPTLKSLGERFNSERVRINTLKIYLDGVVESRTAHLLEDYADTPGNRGGSLLSREELEGLMVELEREGLHLHIHALGDQAVRTSLDAVENVRQSLGRPLGIRVALTHLQLIDQADWPRFAELDVIAQFTPAWHGNDEAVYGQALGGRVARNYPVRPLLDTGAVVNFSSDVYFPSEWHDGSASPFTGMQVGHRRQYREDAPDGPRSGPPSEQLPLEVLVQGYTRSGAWQLGQESVLGSLEAGKRADFIVLGEDLFTLDPTRISGIVPELVVLDGVPVAVPED
jgi:predicted amidohydrolase YtcJ